MTTNTAKTNRPWHKSEAEVLQLLALKNAMSAAKGKPCPVAARVVWRLEMLQEMSSHAGA